MREGWRQRFMTCGRDKRESRGSEIIGVDAGRGTLLTEEAGWYSSVCGALQLLRLPCPLSPTLCPPVSCPWCPCLCLPKSHPATKSALAIHSPCFFACSTLPCLSLHVLPFSYPAPEPIPIAFPAILLRLSYHLTAPCYRPRQGRGENNEVKRVKR